MPWSSWITWVPTRRRQSASGWKRRAWNFSTCPVTRPISARSSRCGPRSRRSCAPSPPAPWMPSRSPWPTPSTRSRPRTPAAGSSTAATLSPPIDPQSALGAVNWHTGETVVIARPHKRRREVAELLEALLAKHCRETVYVAWDNANTHGEDEVEGGAARGRRSPGAALPATYSPLAQPDRDALAPLPARGHALRAVRQRRCAHCRHPSLLRALQSDTRRRALHHRSTPRMSFDDVLRAISHSVDDLDRAT